VSTLQIGALYNRVYGTNCGNTGEERGLLWCRGINEQDKKRRGISIRNPPSVDYETVRTAHPSFHTEKRLLMASF